MGIIVKLKDSTTIFLVDETPLEFEMRIIKKIKKHQHSLAHYFDSFIKHEYSNESALFQKVCQLTN
jgi:hypothetical protein